MSLLMQALKKAERARQSGLHVEDVGDNGHDFPDAPAGPDAGAAPTAPEDHTPAPAARAAGGLELSLEPIDDRPAPPARAEPPPTPPAPEPAPIEPAVEAAHNPVPPQARHESARARVDADPIPVADARPAPRPAGSEPPRRGPGAPERRATPRTTAVQPENTSGFDMARLRIAGLSGLLVVVAATFGYLYWQAVTGPGPGASLPMVPMPPPSATGATTAGGDGGIVVAPAGPPFGPLGITEPAVSAPAGQAMAAPAAPPPAVATAVPAEPAPPPAASPTQRARRTVVPAGPTPAQLAAIEDPAIREEAMRDAAERAEQAERMGRAERIARGSVEAPAMPGGPASLEEAMPGPLAAATPVAAAPAGDMHVARGPSAPGIHPGVQAGYQAFGAGDLATARQQYAAALRQDPNNRDALLGSAAVALRERRDEDAAGYYARILAANPRDAEAIAGLTSLRPGDGDRAEVRLRGVLRNNPDAAPVLFALGNLYARQGRWQEAQQAYFRAWTAAPANADYAFNLAVGLDRLNHGRLAREYYERALALAAGGSAAFDRAAVQRRLLELAQAQPAAAPALPARATTPAGN